MLMLRQYLTLTLSLILNVERILLRMLLEHHTDPRCPYPNCSPACLPLSRAPTLMMSRDPDDEPSLMSTDDEPSLL